MTILDQSFAPTPEQELAAQPGYAPQPSANAGVLSALAEGAHAIAQAFDRTTIARMRLAAEDKWRKERLAAEDKWQQARLALLKQQEESRLRNLEKKRQQKARGQRTYRSLLQSISVARPTSDDPYNEYKKMQQGILGNPDLTDVQRNALLHVLDKTKLGEAAIRARELDNQVEARYIELSDTMTKLKKELNVLNDEINRLQPQATGMDESAQAAQKQLERLLDKRVKYRQEIAALDALMARILLRSPRVFQQYMGMTIDEYRKKVAKERQAQQEAEQLYRNFGAWQQRLSNIEAALMHGNQGR